VRVDDGERGVVESAVCVRLRDGFAFGGVLGSGLCAIARVERVVERLAVVVAGDGVLRALERAFGRGELLGRVLGGARVACGVDGLLCLLDFSFVGGRRCNLP
jgi:hypothetical protein